MKPCLALSFILASACARPQLAHTVAEMATTASHRVAPNIVGATTHSPAGAHHYTAGAVVPHPVNYVAPPAPAPFTIATQAEGVTTVHQPAPVVTKQVHLGETSFVSGYATRILKPATPHLPISVPTVRKGSVAYNAPIVKEQIEVHQVQNPGLVERRIEVPYDLPVYQENIVKVPTPVHVDAPYNVHVPTPVAGEPIIKRTQVALLPYTHAVVPVEAPRLTVSLGAYQVKSEKPRKPEKKPPSL